MSQLAGVVQVLLVPPVQINCPAMAEEVRIAASGNASGLGFMDFVVRFVLGFFASESAASRAGGRGNEMQWMRRDVEWWLASSTSHNGTD